MVSTQTSGGFSNKRSPRDGSSGSGERLVPVQSRPLGAIESQGKRQKYTRVNAIPGGFQGIVEEDEETDQRDTNSGQA